MQKNYLLIYLFLLLLSLTCKKLGWPGGGTLLCISTSLVIIEYMRKLIKPKDISKGLNLVSCTIIPSYMIFTVIGILFRHQFWAIPHQKELFCFVWPIFSLVIISELIIRIQHIKRSPKEVKKNMIREYIIPFVVAFSIAIPTFYSTPKNFVRMFKSYSYQELIEYWNNTSKQK